MSKTLIIAAVAGLLVLAALLVFVPRAVSTVKPRSTNSISTDEQSQIESWIVADKLNQYGDPIGTIYPGGSPLFNEQTGQSMDRYQYILAHHPDQPWLKR